jgi:hypothetical protein
VAEKLLQEKIIAESERDRVTAQFSRLKSSEASKDA